MDAMPRLVELDSAATAGIILSSFPQEHAAAVKQLQGSPLLQYKYLKSALQVRSAAGPWHGCLMGRALAIHPCCDLSQDAIFGANTDLSIVQRRIPTMLCLHQMRPIPLAS